MTAFSSSIDSIVDEASLDSALSSMTSRRWQAFVDSMRAIPDILPVVDVDAINQLDERSDDGFVAAPNAD
jgi:hypothetical protein